MEKKKNVSFVSVKVVGVGLPVVCKSSDVRFSTQVTSCERILRLSLEPMATPIFLGNEGGEGGLV